MNLIEKALGISKEERRLTCGLLEVLREIEGKMLYLDCGYSSLFDFVVRHLGYSEGAAYRRIESMRLIRDVPSVKEHIESGELSISVAAKVRKLSRKKAKK